jgi:hypothetical protein
MLLLLKIIVYLVKECAIPTTIISNKDPTSLENILPFEIWLYPIER